jgi:hypothetical protein
VISRVRSTANYAVVSQRAVTNVVDRTLITIDPSLREIFVFRYVLGSIQRALIGRLMKDDATMYNFAIEGILKVR